ncbi:MAG TPA: GHKL domain-containing protein [Candidatus Lachnoclostridium stercoravium]|uniref:GHKL domain-containing protein n=1 Tax=Candidatus Lachnoclostridium stercoravium TaxID=2838633 RepID=A0A9D2HGX9_9FIRM|nr:GHKL domain-containing protein [Candidatus Lachnoclostridium stercoravium]
MDAEKMKILIVCIYGLVCFLPYACLSLYPFSNRLRFSLKGTALICILWAAAKEAVVYFLIQAQAGGWLFGMHWICGIPFMLILVSGNWSQVLFAQCLLYSQMTVFPYMSSWLLCDGNTRGLPVLLFLTALCFIGIAFSFKKILLPLLTARMNIVLKRWSLFWMIPYVVYLLICSNCYFWEAARKNVNDGILVINLIFLNLFFLLIYMILNSVLMENADALHREKDIKNMALISRQYDKILERQENIRKLRHDTRHFIRVMNEMLQKKDLDGLQDYLYQYGEITNRASQFDTVTICSNPMVNGIVSYYLSEAKNAGIDVYEDCDLKEPFPVSGLELSGMIGNLLENALEACQRMEGGNPFIRLILKSQGNGILVLLVENSYQGQIRTKGENFLSSKRNDIGLGLSSVCDTVERAGGTVKIGYDGAVFRVSIMLTAAVKETQ